MKIAFIFPRFTGPYGGERHLIKLSESLYQLGSKVDIYTHKFNPNIISSSIHVNQGFYPKINNHNLTSIMDLFLMPLLVRKVTKKYDLIILMGWQSALGGYILKKSHRIEKKTKFIYYALEPPRIVYDLKSETLSKSSLIKKSMLKLLIPVIKKIDYTSVKSMDEIVSNSEWTAKQIKHIYNRDSYVMYPGIEIERFGKLTKKLARRELHLKNDASVFLSVSKLHPRKRLDKALEIYKKQAKKSSIFYIIGRGPDEQRLKKIVKEKVITNVRFVGQVSDDLVATYMIASDYFIFTAVNEPFGIAPLEAKAAGVKVIPDTLKHKPLTWKEAGKKNYELFKSFISE